MKPKILLQAHSCKSVVLMTLVSLVFSPAIYADDFSIGIVPQFEAKRLQQIWNPILDELSVRTGDHYTLLGNSSIPEFESSYEKGEFDFIYSNPWHAVIANETQGYIPIIKDGSRKLKGILVVRENDPIKDIKELDGKEIAFPAPNALGAALLMRADLKKLFGLDINPVYVDTHPSVYLNVVLGSTSAGGGVKRTLNQQPENIRDKLRILYETRPVNPHPISVHPRVPEAGQKKFVEAFLALSKDPKTLKLLQAIPIKQATRASIEDYSVLESWGLREFYVR